MNDNTYASEIGDAELLAYLDGEVEPDLATRIEASEAYLSRAKELARLNQRITANLYRRVCPDTIELGEYHLGMLASKQALAIEAHLTECPHCSRELAQLSAYLVEEKPEPSTDFAEKAKVLVGRLVSDISGGTPGELTTAPALVVRGEESETLVYEADGVQISVGVLEDSEQPGAKVILGLVTGIAAEGFEVRVILEGEPTASTQVDDLGNFEVSGLTTAEYEIIIAGNGVEVHIPAIRV